MPNPAQRGRADRVAGTGPTARRGLVAVTATAAVAGALLLTGCGNSDSGPQKVVSAGGPVTSGASAAKPGSSEGASPAPSKPGNGTGTAAPSGGAKSSPSGGAPSSSSSTSGGGGGGGGGNTPAPAAVTRCHTSELSLSVGENHPGAGQENFALVLTNKSGHTCTVSGFPGLAFVDNRGSQVSVNPERTGSSGGQVKVAPGATAWAPLSFTNPEVSGAGKVTPPTVRVTPPDEKVALIVPWDGGPVPADAKTSGPRVGSFSAGSGD
ncbi:DUF4232 domain-containing protein [Streptomyces sp. NBC_00859]|uniref:DUF4232 domain-containing protein n=1 Tax=Streptomyces sp. NBC_00859 TaxID=2903682 RepID=UPI00386F24F2|nr:DUF4232 domain-containing protein [Streptomyces sp. NBC_00859]